MSINLPNHFTCRSRTLVFDSGEEVDFSPVAQAGLPEDLARQLRTGRFLVTLSSVTSTSSADRTFDFREVLLKVPVAVGGTDYLFPVAAYVDHEYSLVRGYLLGFNKFFTAPTADEFTLAAGGLTLDASMPEVGALEPALLPSEQSLPLLLWTDYSVGDAHSHGYGTLAVEGYERTAVTELELPGEQVILSRTMKPVAAYEVRDAFDVTGTLPFGTNLSSD